MALPDPRFFHCTGALTAELAAEIGGGTVIRDGGAKVETAAAAEEGGAKALIFVERINAAMADAAAIIVPPGQGADVSLAFSVVIEAPSPRLCFAKIARHLFESWETAAGDGSPDRPDATIDPSAKIHPTAVIGPDAQIASGVTIGPFAYIGHGVIIGEGSVVGAHTSITHAVLGARCRISAGARIGEAGFGYTASDTGPYHIPQLGIVRLGDEVDIGANTTVDRGMLTDTVIGAMSKIDNLCQVGHNCKIGRGVLVASQTGISGSCVVGDFVMMGGQVGMADHLTIGDGAVLAAKAGLMRDVEPGGKVGGTPAKPMRQWMKETAALGRLAQGKKDGKNGGKA